MPLPGMNPYLEQPMFWSAFHSRLIVAIADAIAPRIRPRYYVEIETRTYLGERYLEIREVATGEVVTAIEVLSPKNKEAGRGRQKYEEKRLTILGSLTHLVEIDLLRGGRSMSVGGHIAPTHYRILVSPSENRPRAMLYGFSLREPIPSFLLPLKGDLSPIVDMQAIVAGIYERAGYDLRIDYTKPPPPPALSESDRLWLQECLQTS